MTRRYTGGFLSATEQATDANTANGIYTLQEAGQATAVGNFPTGRWTPQRSLRFRNSASAWLSRVPSVASGNSQWTYSAWLKINPSATTYIISANGNSSGTRSEQSFLFSGGQFQAYGFNNGSGYGWNKFSNELFRDPAAWYHIVIWFDADNSDSTKRVRTWVNNKELTWATQTDSGAGGNWSNFRHINNTGIYSMAIGAGWQSGGAPPYFTDGYVSEAYMVSSSLITPSSFGATDPETGTWIPKQYTGTYGTNGFYLPFSDNSHTQAIGRNFGVGSNYVGYSETLGSWQSQVNTSVTANTTVAPDGNTTADTVTTTSASSGSYHYHGASVSNTTPFTASMYFKAGTVSVVTMSEGYWTGAYASFSLTGAGSVTGSGSGATNAKIESIANGWYRCSFTATSGNTTWGFRFEPRATYGGAGAIGDSVIAWGAQLNFGTTVGPYSVTTATLASNDWTSNNISLTAGTTYDSMVDVPGIASVSNQVDIGGVQRGNYCTWNTAGAATNVTYSDAALTTTSTVNSIKTALATIAVGSSGKWYFEQTITAQSDAYRNWLGFIEPSMRADEAGFYLNDAPGFSASWNSGNTSVTYGTSNKFTSSPTGGWDVTTATVSDTRSAGDVFMYAYDGTSGKIWFGKNGTWYSSGSPSTGVNPAGILSTQFNYTPAASMNVTGSGNSVTLNCGQRPFAYTPPTGFKSICTTNLPNPVIKRPSDHFDIRQWRGNNQGQQIGFVNKQSTGYLIPKSLRIRSGNTSFLSRTPTASGNQKTFTISAWIKQGRVGSPNGAYNYIYTSGNTGSISTNYFVFGLSATSFLDSNDTVKLTSCLSNSTQFSFTSVEKFSDPGKWYHVMAAVDTTQAEPSNRVKLYVNGARLTPTTSTSYPSQNLDIAFVNNSSYPQYIGKITTYGNYDGHIAEFNYIDGAQKSPSDFGQFDAYNTGLQKRILVLTVLMVITCHSI